MKKSLKSLILLLMALIVPVTATAAYDQLVEGVYLDGTKLYITSGVTSLGDLQVDPSEIYCYATIPPACVSNTFTGYGATLHVPAAGMVSYFTALYWYNFNNILSDAIEPLSVTMNTSDAELEIGQQLSLSATVAPGDATPKAVYWSSSDSSVATVSSGGTVTAVAAGECDILATCVDKVAICHVVVVPPHVTITLDKHEARLLPNHTMALTATCLPINVDLAVTSSNPAVAIPRLVNGTIMVVGVAEGTATITVNAADGWGNPDACEVTVYTEHGDVNCDGYVSIGDVTKLIDYLLSGDPEGVNAKNADTNRNGSISISDVTTLIDYLLSGIWPWSEPEHEEFTVNGVTFKMVTVDDGSFTMGNDAGISWEQPAHNVSLSSYEIGETEVTQALWQAVMGSNPAYFTGDLTRPVEQVSWNDCQLFIYKLNEMTGKQFRLPTEAEWEYAARGGNRSHGYIFAGSNNVDDVAWSNNPNGDSSFSNGSSTFPVGAKKGNELGLFDMSGNVWEYVQDWWDSYSSVAQTNPNGPVFGDKHVIRGGCVWTIYANNPEYRVSYRNSYEPNESNRYIGLRLALDKDNSSKFCLSETVVTVMIDSSKSVDILNGNGSYTTSDGDGIVTTSINGNKLTVTGTAEGVSTVHITDTSTGAASVLTVITQPQEETFTVNGVSFTMVAIEGGTFTMGATAEQGSNAGSDEMPTHQVTLSMFAIGKTEVTQALWQAVMDSNPSYLTGDSKRPVEQVSWNDCQAFVTKLNQLTGRIFRLPTEAEWEFAARGGNKSKGYKYAGSYSIFDVAWYYSNGALSTHPVAARVPNELGIYDMSGNVMEWCQDWYSNYTSDAQINPTGPISGSSRVCRGGSWYSSEWQCRVSCRFNFTPTSSHYYLGLRLAL